MANFLNEYRLDALSYVAREYVEARLIEENSDDALSKWYAFDAAFVAAFGKKTTQVFMDYLDTCKQFNVDTFIDLLHNESPVL